MAGRSYAKVPPRDARELEMWIRETQMARAYAFPPAYAPEGRLREADPSVYMQLCKLHYSYRASIEDLILELNEEGMSGEVVRREKVGEVFSVDLEWTPDEAIRLHLIAMRKRRDKVLEHYQVFDLGNVGVAVTFPRIAWDNWRTWGHLRVEGIPVDKRLAFLAVGDRSQIGNMDLETFSRMTADQVRALTERFIPGQCLVRPSLEEACLIEEEVRHPTPPLVELSSDSSEGEGRNPEEWVGNLEKPKAGAPKGKGAGYQHKAQKGKIDFTPGKFRAPVFKPEDRMFLGPDGKVYPRSVMDNLTDFFTECVFAPITPPKKITIMDSNPPMPEEERESIMARFGPEGVEIIPYEPSEMSPLGQPAPRTLKATLVEDTSSSPTQNSFDGDTSDPSWNAPSSGMGDISGV